MPHDKNQKLNGEALLDKFNAAHNGADTNMSGYQLVSAANLVKKVIERTTVTPTSEAFAQAASPILDQPAPGTPELPAADIDTAQVGNTGLAGTTVNNSNYQLTA